MTAPDRAALVERVRGEFWASHPHIRGGAIFDEVIEFFLKREQAAKERTREAAAQECDKTAGARKSSETLYSLGMMAGGAECWY